ELPVALRALPPRKMPAFWNAPALPRPLLRGREKALSLEAMESLGAHLATFARDALMLEGAPPLVKELRELCDPTSLFEFSWALFSAWLLSGAPAKDAWAFLALGLLGGDEAARRLAPSIRAWPG